ncbi:MAG: HAMP domain-containing histidine kinase, partial [Oligoflexia bacterium]|nr:HAMP domain-containing histidine kinase [Oligoflexia bacterium]
DINVHDLIKSSVTLVEQATKRKLNRIVNINDKLQLFANRIELHQLFFNIIKNAYDATPDTGTIYITAQDQNEKIQISIQDSGSGIPADIMDKMFIPFFTTKKVGSGTGLGLYWSLNIIKKHRGEIRAENSKSGGAIFTITLPKAIKV